MLSHHRHRLSILEDFVIDSKDDLKGIVEVITSLLAERYLPGSIPTSTPLSKALNNILYVKQTKGRPQINRNLPGKTAVL